MKSQLEPGKEGEEWVLCVGEREKKGEKNGDDEGEGSEGGRKRPPQVFVRGRKEGDRTEV